MNRFTKSTILFFLCFTLRSIANPTFSLPHGIYDDISITIAISPSVADAEIRYTTDGSIPTESSTLYTDPLTISQTTVLRAIEILVGGVILE